MGAPIYHWPRCVFVWLCSCVCLAVVMEGVVFPVLRLLVSDAGGQLMRWSGRFTAESVHYSIWTESSFALAPQNSSNCQRRCWHDCLFPSFSFFSFSLIAFSFSLSFSFSFSNRKWVPGETPEPALDARRQDQPLPALSQTAEPTNQSKLYGPARPIITQKLGFPAKLAQLEAKECYTFMTFISSVCQHTVKGSQRCITAMYAVHASLT